MASRAVDSRSRRYDPIETRQRVLEAANRLFATQGFAATGTADVARVADVSEGSIFYHFGSKKNLLFEVGRMYGERLIAMMQGDDALEDLEPGAIITRCIDFCIEHREWETLTGTVCIEGKPKALAATEAEPFYHAARGTVVAWAIAQMSASLAKRGVSGIDIPCAASFTHAVIGKAIEAVLATDNATTRRAIIDETIRYTRAACGYAAE